MVSRIVFFFMVVNAKLALCQQQTVTGEEQAASTRLRQTAAADANTKERHMQIDTIWDALDAILNGELLDGMSMPLSDMPSSSPVVSDIPSHFPTSIPTEIKTIPPTIPIDIEKPSTEPSLEPSTEPSLAPVAVVISPTNAPTLAPVPTSAAPSEPIGTTETPTLSNCPGISEDERIEQLLAILDNIANPDEIRDNALPQGLATTWLLEQDEFQACPSDDSCEMIQRWTLAVMYFSMGGNNWFQCASDLGGNNPTDNCGSEQPFENDERFLSNVDECSWAGISCIDGCVSEIEYGTCIKYIY
jgi:hypothetical protein